MSFSSAPDLLEFFHQGVPVLLNFDRYHMSAFMTFLPLVGGMFIFSHMMLKFNCYITLLTFDYKELSKRFKEISRLLCANIQVPGTGLSRCICFTIVKISSEFLVKPLHNFGIIITEAYRKSVCTSLVCATNSVSPDNLDTPFTIKKTGNISKFIFSKHVNIVPQYCTDY